MSGHGYIRVAVLCLFATLSFWRLGTAESFSDSLLRRMREKVETLQGLQSNDRASVEQIKKEILDLHYKIQEVFSDPVLASERDAAERDIDELKKDANKLLEAMKNREAHIAQLQTEIDQMRTPPETPQTLPEPPAPPPPPPPLLAAPAPPSLGIGDGGKAPPPMRVTKADTAEPKAPTTISPSPGNAPPTSFSGISSIRGRSLRGGAPEITGTPNFSPNPQVRIISMAPSEERGTRRHSPGIKASDASRDIDVSKVGAEFEPFPIAKAQSGVALEPFPVSGAQESTSPSPLNQERRRFRDRMISAFEETPSRSAIARSTADSEASGDAAWPQPNDYWYPGRPTKAVDIIEKLATSTDLKKDELEKAGMLGKLVSTAPLTPIAGSKPMTQSGVAPRPTPATTTFEVSYAGLKQRTLNLLSRIITLLAKGPTTSKQKGLLASFLGSTKKTKAQGEAKPRFLLPGSVTGIYGDAARKEADDSTVLSGFPLPAVGLAWIPVLGGIAWLGYVWRRRRRKPLPPDTLR